MSETREQAQASGKHLAQQAREAASPLTEQIRWAIEHGAEGPDPSVVDTEVMACDYVIYAVFDLVREALLSNDVQAPIRQELHDYPRTSTRDTVKTVIDMALDAITGEGRERR